MRYFTKEWYELTNKTAYTAMLDIIEADGISFKDIYIFKLDKELKRRRAKKHGFFARIKSCVMNRRRKKGRKELIKK